MRFKTGLPLLAALIAIGCGGGGGSSASAPPPSPSSPASTVIYQSNASGSADIYAIKADGTGNTALATTSDDEYARVLSGDRLIYIRTTAAQKDLLSVKLDGTGTAVLAASAGDDIYAGMAGSRVIYLQKNPTTYDLRSVNLDGTGNVLLAANVRSDAYASGVLMDGSRVIFTSLASGAGDLYSVQADGTGLTALATSSTLEQVSAYAPNALDTATGLVIYTRDEGSGNYTVHAVQPDGSGHVQLTASLPNAGPASIASGRVVYWTQNASGGYSVYSVRLDGTGTVALAADPTKDQRGNLLVGGRLMIDVRTSSSVQEVYAVNLDGTNPALLSPSGQLFGYDLAVGDQVLLQQGNYVSPVSRLFLAKTDGTSLTPLTPAAGQAYSEGTWGGRVYYELLQAGQIDLFSCAPDGTGVVTLGGRTDVSEQTPMQAGDRVVYNLYQATGGAAAGVVSVKPDGGGAITLASGPCTAALIQ
ncbi:MAG TPA: DUF5050 domain-containing protein [Holophagaceae bacterium]|nr:DUF5050 domain-containing protein [Holophagaceae bacterium]